MREPLWMCGCPPANVFATPLDSGHVTSRLAARETDAQGDGDDGTVDAEQRSIQTRSHEAPVAGYQLDGVLGGNAGL